MKILGIEKRDVYVAVELGLDEMQNIVRFLSKAVSMYNHVYGDSERELIEEIIEFDKQLETVIGEIKKNES